jgi:ribonuclease R
MTDELRALGHRSLPENSQDLNRIVRAVQGKPEQYMVTLTLLRNMKRAVYEAESGPHFGLGFDHYAHFTSPIRRYPDLVLHRILIAIEEGRKQPAYSVAEIEKLALHCSETERESSELESQSIQIKRIRYFASLLEKGEVGPFKGTIISLNPKGLIVELSESLQQGMLPYYSLGRERFILSGDGHSAAAHRGSAYRLGQSIEVGLAAVDEHLKRVDFFLPGTERTRDGGRPAGHRPPPPHGPRPDRNARPKPAAKPSKSGHKSVDKPPRKGGNTPSYGPKHAVHQRRRSK